MSIAAIWVGQCNISSSKKFSFSSRLDITNLAIEPIINNSSGISGSSSATESKISKLQQYLFVSDHCKIHSMNAVAQINNCLM